MECEDHLELVTAFADAIAGKPLQLLSLHFSQLDFFQHSSLSQAQATITVTFLQVSSNTWTAAATSQRLMWAGTSRTRLEEATNPMLGSELPSDR